jgi:hypothetical protein
VRICRTVIAEFDSAANKSFCKPKSLISGG